MSIINYQSSTEKVAFKTLGCKLNFAETSAITDDFKKNGYECVKFNEYANVYVINSCTVTEYADKKCRQAVKKIQKINPDAIIAVIGCYAQLKPDEIINIDGVDIVLGANEKFKLFDYIKNHKKENKPVAHSCEIQLVKHFDAAFSLGERTRSFLKIQDGCNYPCTYCTIPKARGYSRNNSIKNTVNQAVKIAELGYKEIILTGVNIGDFGRSTKETFFDLIKELDKVTGIERYRISSIEPNLLTNEIIEFCSRSDKFLPHYHIPLQSGCDRILKLMKRRYKRKLFAERIEHIKKIDTDAFIGVDIIVGFPGEGEDEFKATYDFLKQLDISFLHVFSYSVRPDTPAADMSNKVDKHTIKNRSKILHELSHAKHLNFYRQNINKKAKVLFEAKNEKGKMYGFTENYIKVKTDFNPLLINSIENVVLDTLDDDNVFEVSVSSL